MKRADDEITPLFLGLESRARQMMTFDPSPTQWTINCWWVSFRWVVWGKSPIYLTIAWLLMWLIIMYNLLCIQLASKQSIWNFYYWFIITLTEQLLLYWQNQHYVTEFKVHFLIVFWLISWFRSLWCRLSHMAISYHFSRILMTNFYF